MRPSAQDAYDWYDDEQALMGITPETKATLAGLPASWRYYEWWIAGIGFAALWMVESWTSGGSAPGADGVLFLLQAFGKLLIAVAVCYGIYRLSAPRAGKLGSVLTVLGAVLMFAGFGIH
jgi:hypothetical protein